MRKKLPWTNQKITQTEKNSFLQKLREKLWVEKCVNIAGPSQGLKIRGGLVVLGGENVPPLVEIGLTDLPKTGGA